MIEARSDAVKRNMVSQPGMLRPSIKANWKGSNRRWQQRMLTFYESVDKNGLEWVNLTQMTIISTTVGKNPLEEME